MQNDPFFEIQDAADLYSIDRWGGGYFGVNDAGHVVVRPKRNGETIDLMEVVAEARAHNLAFPLVVRFHDLLRHLEHAVAVVGADHVGIGCDLDGGGGWFEGLRDVSDFPNITQGLVARGWGEETLAKVWGQSTLRLFRAVQRSAG